MSKGGKYVWFSNSTGPNANHKAYINNLGHDIYYIDTRLKGWENSANRLKRIISWFINAILFSNNNKYKGIVSIGLHMQPVILKKLGLLQREQKIICFHATEVLYFLKEKKFSSFTHKIMIYALNCYDAHICVSKMMSNLLIEVTEGKAKSIYSTFNGVPDSRYDSLHSVYPNFEKYNIVFVGNIYSEWRNWYKGIDLLFGVFEKLLVKYPDASLSIIGETSRHYVNYLTGTLKKDTLDRIHFVGKTSNLTEYFKQASLYIHCARGEAFGISIIEAMASGLPSLVSEWTGAKEVVMSADPSFVLPLDIEKIYDKVDSYFSISKPEKIKLSQKFKEAVQPYTQSKAKDNLKRIFEDISSNILSR